MSLKHSHDKSKHLWKIKVWAFSTRKEHISTLPFSIFSLNFMMESTLAEALLDVKPIPMGLPFNHYFATWIIMHYYSLNKLCKIFKSSTMVLSRKNVKSSPCQQNDVKSFGTKFMRAFKWLRTQLWDRHKPKIFSAHNVLNSNRTWYLNSRSFACLAFFCKEITKLLILMHKYNKLLKKIKNKQCFERCT